jgi:hypothetical protein
MVLCNTRVPVVGKDGNPLMPTKASRARRWINEGQAVLKWSQLGMFYVQLTADAGSETQDVGLGLDPGSQFDGIAVISKKGVLLTGMTELPQGIPKKWSNGETNDETGGIENVDEEKSDLITEHDQKTGWRQVRRLKWSLNSLSYQA